MELKKLITGICLLFTLPVFAQAPDMSLIPYRQGDLWGYANPDKSIAIKPAYNEANLFYAGYAVVKKGTKYGYINKAGKVVIPFKFFTAKPFTYGYFDGDGKHTAGGKTVKNKDTVLFAGASLNASGREVCIDTRGLTMSKCPAINETYLNTQAVDINDSVKIYTLVANAVYDKLVDDYKVTGDEHTYYIGVKNNRYGVINNTFDVVVPFDYDSVKKVNVNGAFYLQAQKGNRYGMYNGNGSVFIPVEKSSLSYVKPGESNGYFIQTKDGIAKLKDLQNQDVLTTDYSDIQYDRNRGFVLTGIDNTKGYYFLNNKTVSPKYTEVNSIRGGDYLLVKTKTGKWGYVSAGGVEFFDE